MDRGWVVRDLGAVIVFCFFHFSETVSTKITYLVLFFIFKKLVPLLRVESKYPIVCNSVYMDLESM